MLFETNVDKCRWLSFICCATPKIFQIDQQWRLLSFNTQNIADTLAVEIVIIHIADMPTVGARYSSGKVPSITK